MIDTLPLLPTEGTLKRFSDHMGRCICRTIEINLSEQLGESDVPSKLDPVGGVLM